MKTVVGIVALGFIALLAIWSLGRPGSIQNTAGPIEAPSDVTDPVRAGEATPPGFRQLLPRDAILPVYNPTFNDVASTDWDDAALIIGVELDGEAKAYPVSFLNRREMVIDWIGGTPILVSW